MGGLGICRKPVQVFCAVLAAAVSALFLTCSASPLGGGEGDVQFLGSDGVVLQQNVNDCGLAALATLARQIGTPIDVAELRRDVSIEGPGLTLLSLRQLARLYGVELQGVRGNPRRPPVLRIPWIAHLSRGVGHYVVVEAVTRSTVTVGDPALGRVRYPAAVFWRLWSGYALVIENLNSVPASGS